MIFHERFNRNQLLFHSWIFLSLLTLPSRSQANFCADLFWNSKLNPQQEQKYLPLNYIRLSDADSRGPQPLLWPQMILPVKDFLHKINISDQELPHEALEKVTLKLPKQDPSYTDYLELKKNMLKNWKAFLRPQTISAKLALELYEQLQVLSFIENYIQWPSHIQKKLQDQSKAQDLASSGSTSKGMTPTTDGIFSEKNFSKSKNHRINQEGAGENSQAINIYSEFSDIYFDYGYRQIVNASGMFENSMMNPSKKEPTVKRNVGNLRWSTQDLNSEVRIPLQKGTRPLSSQLSNGDPIIEKFPGVFYILNQSQSKHFELPLMQDSSNDPLTEAQISFHQAPSGISSKYFEKSVLNFLNDLQMKKLSDRSVVLSIQDYLMNSGVFKYYNYSEDHKADFYEIDQKMHQLEQEMPSAAASTHIKVIQCERASELAMIFLRDFFKIPSRVVVGFRGKLNASEHAIMDSPIGHAWIEVWLNGKFERFEVTPYQRYKNPTEGSSQEEKSSTDLKNTTLVSKNLKNIIEIEKELQSSIQESLKKISEYLRTGQFFQAKELAESLSEKIRQLEKERPLTELEKNLNQKLALALTKIHQETERFDEREVLVANFFYHLPSPLVEKAVLLEYGLSAKVPGTQAFEKLHQDLIQGKLRAIELLHQIEKRNSLLLSGRPEPRTTYYPTGDPALNATRFHDITPAISADQFEMFVGDRRPGQGLLDAFLRGEQLSFGPVEQFPRVDPYNIDHRHIVMVLSDHSPSIPLSNLADFSVAQDAWVIQHMMSQKGMNGSLLHEVHYTQFGWIQSPTTIIQTETQAIEALRDLFFKEFHQINGTIIDDPILDAYDRILQGKLQNNDLQYADILLSSDGEQSGGPIRIQDIQEKQQQASALGLNVRFNVFNYHSYISSLKDLSESIHGNSSHSANSSYHLFEAKTVKDFYESTEKERQSKLLHSFHYQANLDTLRLAREISYTTWKPSKLQPDLKWLLAFQQSLELWLTKDRYFLKESKDHVHAKLSFPFSSLNDMKELSSWSTSEKKYYLEQLLKTEFFGQDIHRKNFWSKYHLNSLEPIHDYLKSLLEAP